MRRTYGMQLTIEKYTQLVAPLDLRAMEGSGVPIIRSGSQLAW
ncbi:MAG TPA: hypothetical protein VJW23_08000 [Propionibacteriaceae bacterium]|nr:hypothetical protein [Propionibacteriaceae bacterium]